MQKSQAIRISCRVVFSPDWHGSLCCCASSPEKGGPRACTAELSSNWGTEFLPSFGPTPPPHATTDDHIVCKSQKPPCRPSIFVNISRSNRHCDNTPIFERRRISRNEPFILREATVVISGQFRYGFQMDTAAPVPLIHCQRDFWLERFPVLRIDDDSFNATRDTAGARVSYGD